MWLLQIAEHKKVAHLTPPTTHRSIQRADLFTACRHATLRMQMDRIVRGRHDNEVWSDREAHASARQAVETVQRMENLRRRGENEEGGRSDDEGYHIRARSENNRHGEFPAKTEYDVRMHGAGPSRDAARATPYRRSRPWRSRSR